MLFDSGTRVRTCIINDNEGAFSEWPRRRILLVDSAAVVDEMAKSTARQKKVVDAHERPLLTNIVGPLHSMSVYSCRRHAVFA